MPGGVAVDVEVDVAVAVDVDVEVRVDVEAAWSDGRAVGCARKARIRKSQPFKGEISGEWSSKLACQPPSAETSRSEAPRTVW